MKERPILFSAPMVRAILNGSKTQTRRIVKPQPGPGFEWCRVIQVGPWFHIEADKPETVMHTVHSPYGGKGDLLWVKENWRGRKVYDAQRPNEIPAGEEIHREVNGPLPAGTRYGKLRPSIFMPRWMSRITLEITGVRVERLNDISEADAKDEGAIFHDGRPVGHHGWRHDINHGFVYETAKRSYANLWESINGDGSWALNPWVWCIEFRRLP